MAKMPANFEKKDKAADKKQGVKEGSKRDDMLDAAAMKKMVAPKPGKRY